MPYPRVSIIPRHPRHGQVVCRFTQRVDTASMPRSCLPCVAPGAGARPASAAVGSRCRRAGILAQRSTTAMTRPVLATSCAPRYGERSVWSAARADGVACAPRLMKRRGARPTACSSAWSHCRSTSSINASPLLVQSGQHPSLAPGLHHRAHRAPPCLAPCGRSGIGRLLLPRRAAGRMDAGDCTGWHRCTHVGAGAPTIAAI